MVATQNGYSRLSRFSPALTTITLVGHSTKLRRGNAAWLLRWVAKQLHYAVEPCVSLYGWRDPAVNDAVGGLKSSNHLSGTAIDYNGGKHPYEYTHPYNWSSGWTAAQSKKIADILRAARVVEWGNNLSLFRKGFRDPMHFAISRYSSAAGLADAVKRLKSGTIKTTVAGVRGREHPNTEAKVLYTRPKGFVIKYVQTEYRDGYLWVKSNHGTWYATKNTTF